MKCIGTRGRVGTGWVLAVTVAGKIPSQIGNDVFVSELSSGRNLVVDATQVDFVRVQTSAGVQTDSCEVSLPPATPERSDDVYAWLRVLRAQASSTPVQRALFVDVDESEEMELDCSYRPLAALLDTTSTSNCPDVVDMLLPTTTSDASEPATALTSTSNGQAEPAAEPCSERKFIVFESCLQQLLSPTCTVCHMPWYNWPRSLSRDGGHPSHFGNKVLADFLYQEPCTLSLLLERSRIQQCHKKILGTFMEQLDSAGLQAQHRPEPFKGLALHLLTVYASAAREARLGVPGTACLPPFSMKQVYQTGGQPREGLLIQFS
ncbi:hypothetical protein HPB49_011855 [Dermacentor silvarum]|uniref:Uncharacterized protein n=1 Tax=Dermacentor silvarum TaxID=543639 RepID=A0ACB8DZY4_DERSI|nr:hypothetical protein HPB49_011855 [Dermacentor silvarum]